MDYMIDKLANHNEPAYNEDKLLEEMHELAEIILKIRNKRKDDPKRPSFMDVIEEAGDLKLRLEVFIRMNGIDSLVEERVAKKLSRFAEHIQSDKYGKRV